jgi:hypothetical protein
MKETYEEKQERMRKLKEFTKEQSRKRSIMLGKVESLPHNDLEGLMANIVEKGLLIPESIQGFNLRLEEVPSEYGCASFPKEKRLVGPEVYVLQEEGILYLASKNYDCWFCSGGIKTIKRHLQRTEGSLVQGKNVKLVGDVGYPDREGMDTVVFGEYSKEELMKGSCTGSLALLERDIVEKYMAKSCSAIISRRE